MRIKIPLKWLKPLDYLFILRPTLFFPVWIITLAGYAAYDFAENGVAWWRMQFDWRILLNFTVITLVAGAAFIFNQLQDVDTDRDNRKLFLISDQHVPAGWAKKIALGMISLGLLVFLFQGIWLFGLLALFTLLWGYLYNFQPFAWKDRPILGILTNILGGMLLFSIGWKMNGPICGQTLRLMIPYVLAWGSVALLTTIPDRTGDQKHAKKTFAVAYGDQLTIWMAFAWVAIGFLVGMKFGDPVITHSILLSSPLYIIMLFRPNPVWVLRTIRYGLLFIALFLCAEFPLFFIAILLNFYLARVYYINRFGLDYPTFRVEE